MSHRFGPDDPKRPPSVIDGEVLAPKPVPPQPVSSEEAERRRQRAARSLSLPATGLASRGRGAMARARRRSRRVVLLGTKLEASHSAVRALSVSAIGGACGMYRPPIGSVSAIERAMVCMQCPDLADLRQPISRGFLHTATSGGAPGFLTPRRTERKMHART